MKKYLGRTWAKILAMILLIFAIFMTAFGTFLLILNAEIGEAGLERHFYTICGNSYSAWLFSQEGGIMGDPAMLEGSNMEYAIAESKDGNPNSLDMTDPNVFLYHTPGYKDYINVFVGNDAYDYDYRIDSFPGAWLHGVRPYGEDFYYDDSGAGAVEDKYYIIFYNVKDPLISSEEYSDLFTEAKSASDTLISFMHHASVPMFVCGIILTVLSFVWLMKSAGRRAYDDQIHTRMADRIPFGLYLSGVFILELMGTGCTVSLFQEIGYGPGLTYTILIGLLILGIIAGMIILGMLFMMSIAARVKSKTFARYSLCHYLKHGFIRFRKAVNVHTSLMVRSIALIAILTILQLFVICVTEYDLGFEIVSFIIYKCVEIPLFIYAMFQIAKIIRGTKAIASGDSGAVIDTQRMFWDFKGHAEDINNIGSGISSAVEAQMKSERMKTELITNVSHDIKTPLTSIINYVDLLEKEDLGNEKAVEYVEVLSRQSSRLKKLIGDLIDASKASTGNVELKVEPCDLNVILTQTVGEFEERMTDAGLQPVIAQPEESAFIMADGRQLWRVLENLFSNVCKYALNGTRVYVSLEKHKDRAEISIKNISSTALNISSDELTERFVRGDTSRNTEGSGLGLSIAQSLTRLMGGSMTIDIDGDLFKVILSFPLIGQTI